MGFGFHSNVLREEGVAAAAEWALGNFIVYPANKDGVGANAKSIKKMVAAVSIASVNHCPIVLVRVMIVPLMSACFNIRCTDYALRTGRETGLNWAI